MPSDPRRAPRSSAKTPAPLHTLLQTRDTMSARVRTTAGSRERGRPRAVPGVFCAIHLRCVSMCACSKKDGSALLAKRTHCAMVQSGLTRAKEQRHSSTSGEMSVMHRFVQGSAGSSSPAPWPSCRCIGCQKVLPPRSRCPPGPATCSDDCGHCELHRWPSSPPRWWSWPQLFANAVHGDHELAETLSQDAATGWHVAT